MLPELILHEEEEHRPYLLVLLGVVSGILGFGIASFFFPENVDILSVVFASIPLIFPLLYFLLEEEAGEDYILGIEDYGALFVRILLPGNGFSRRF